MKEKLHVESAVPPSSLRRHICLGLLHISPLHPRRRLQEPTFLPHLLTLFISPNLPWRLLLSSSSSLRRDFFCGIACPLRPSYLLESNSSSALAQVQNFPPL